MYFYKVSFLFARTALFSGCCGVDADSLFDFSQLQRGMSESYPMCHASVIFNIISLINEKIDSGNKFYQSVVNPIDN